MRIEELKGRCTKSASLYIHLPFCRKKCGYCDFYSAPVTANVMKMYIKKIKEQILFYTQVIGIDNFPTVFIGGGTPSSVSISLLEELLSFILNQSNVKPLEITIETNPEDITEEFLVRMYKSGVTRFSMGVQSFNCETLAMLERRNNAEDALKALDIFKSVFASDCEVLLNLDLINMVPGQTIEDCLIDIKTALAYHPDHLSVYSLIPEEGTRFYEKMQTLHIEQPEIDDNILYRYLNDSGMKRYEISNFSLNGKECKHNLVYWNMDNFIGVGTASSGTFSLNDGTICRIETIADVDNFLIQSVAESMNLEIVSREDWMFEHLMMGFRLIDGPDPVRFKDRFNIEIHNVIPETLQEYLKRGLLCSDKISLNEDGLLLLNPFLTSCLQELEKQQ